MRKRRACIALVSSISIVVEYEAIVFIWYCKQAQMCWRERDRQMAQAHRTIFSAISTEWRHHFFFATLTHISNNVASRRSSGRWKKYIWTVFSTIYLRIGRYFSVEAFSSSQHSIELVKKRKRFAFVCIPNISFLVVLVIQRCPRCCNRKAIFNFFFFQNFILRTFWRSDNILI